MERAQVEEGLEHTELGVGEPPPAEGRLQSGGDRLRGPLEGDEGVEGGPLPLRPPVTRGHSFGPYIIQLRIVQY